MAATKVVGVGGERRYLRAKRKTTGLPAPTVTSHGWDTEPVDTDRLVRELKSLRSGEGGINQHQARVKRGLKRR